MGPNTSRKHCQKEPQLFFHRGFFDHPDMQSLKRQHVVFFGFPAYINFKNLGSFNIPLERLFQDPKKKQNCSHQTKMKNLQSFSDCRSGWSKEPQWKNDCGSFSQCFLLVQVPLMPTSSNMEAKSQLLNVKAST
jgi:hypothetical protein